MKICIFSDIHGNQYALRAFIEKLRVFEINHFIFCGDIFGYNYGHAEVIDMLLGIKNLTLVLGNHDKNLLDAIQDPSIIDSLAEKYGNTYKSAPLHVNAGTHIEVLRSLRPLAEITFCGKRILVVHGTNDAPLNGRLYPKDMGQLAALEGIDICVMGHTHFRLCERKGNTLFLNPGSLGQPRDKQKNCFAILSLPECTVEFIDVHYDKSLLDAEIRENDMGNEKLLELLHRSG